MEFNDLSELQQAAVSWQAEKMRLAQIAKHGESDFAARNPDEYRKNVREGLARSGNLDEIVKAYKDDLEHSGKIGSKEGGRSFGDDTLRSLGDSLRKRPDLVRELANRLKNDPIVE